MSTSPFSLVNLGRDRACFPFSCCWLVKAKSKVYSNACDWKSVLKTFHRFFVSFYLGVRLDTLRRVKASENV